MNISSDCSECWYLGLYAILYGIMRMFYSSNSLLNYRMYMDCIQSIPTDDLNEYALSMYVYSVCNGYNGDVIDVNKGLNLCSFQVY